jgi:hypothetical protein
MKRAELRQIALRGVPVKAHRGEGSGGDEKDARDARAGEEQKNSGERQSH